MTIQNQKRKPKYKRVKDAFNIRLQQRDTEIIRQVMRHRLMTSEHIAAILGGSQQLILRRLQKLFHAGYLDRPPEQIQPYQKDGSAPMVYAPGNEGQKLLAEKFGVPLGKLNWSSKNRSIKTRFLSHTLQITSFMIALELACRWKEGLELITPGAVYGQMSEEARKKTKPFIWKVTAKVDENHEKKIYTFGMEPDKVLGLHFPDLPQGKNRTHFFLEADQGTMPLRSASMHRSSIFKKMVGYFNSWEQELFEKTFPFKKARIIFVTTSDKRIANMLELQREFDPKRKGTRMFLFLNQEMLNLKNPSILLDKVFINGRGEMVSLID